jgi:hypothetical protein
MLCALGAIPVTQSVKATIASGPSLSTIAGGNGYDSAAALNEKTSMARSMKPDSGNFPLNVHLVVVNNYQVYLPSVFMNYSAPILLFSDDFSNSSSGWHIDPSTSSYDNGEFRVTVPQSRILFYIAPIPQLTVDNYSLDVDVRRTAGDKVFCGLMFDYVLGPKLYQFGVNPNDQTYTLNAIWATIAYGTNPAIHTGDAVNHLRVERIGSLINLYANGQLLNSLTDSQLSHGWVGLQAESISSTQAECRFDNFSVYQLP